MFSLFDITAKRAELMPDKVAVEELDSGQRITYAMLNERANRFAEALQRLGIEPGERIAILCHNIAAFFEILFGCAKAGVVLVPLNWRLTPAELRPLLDDCGARLLFHDDATASLAAVLQQTHPLPQYRVLPHGAAVSEESYQALLDAGVGRTEWRDPWPVEGLWYMLYTSGTTGVPKAVLQTFGMALANAINIGQAIDLTGRDVTPNYLPLFHTAGINLHTLPTLIVGGSVKVMQKFDPSALLKLIGSGELTALLAVPAVYQAMSLHPNFERTDLRRVRAWSAGGAALSEGLLRLYAQRGARICQGYGMTETGPTVFLMDEASVERKPGSIGKPQLLTRVRIVDDEGRDVATGEAGEYLIKGPNVTPGYWNRPEATREALDADGWLHTGDVGRRDEEGYYYIVDRIKDMYISGGENVYPAEVERVLLTHPAILEAAVIGIPDERWGEAGCAYLIPKPGRQIDTAQVIAFVRQALAAYKVPKLIRVVEDFPRTPAGKVQKHHLRVQHQEVEDA